MSVFRPSNINRRLVGTATTNTAVLSGRGSPGNGGQVGPKKTPYVCGKGFFGLGCRFDGGCCGGVFKVNESQCGVKENCQSYCDFGGNFICCGPSTEKWFVSPFCTAVTRNWYSRGDAVTLADSCVGSCGWFIPSTSQFQNPGYSCRTYWDNCCSGAHWTNSPYPHDPGNRGTLINMSGGGLSDTGMPNSNIRSRAFRCLPT